MSEVHIVTKGWYDDYEIVQVFGDKESAEKLRDTLNEDKYAHADIESYTVQGPDWKPGEYMNTTSYLAIISGDVLDSGSTTARDVAHRHIGQVESSVSLRPGKWRVSTFGDAQLVPEAHAKAIAEKRAEIADAQL
ncbi:DUF7336 domain-containing protein [Streptomyces sp. NPDC055006]